MAEDEQRERRELPQGPQINVFRVMEDVVEKLRLLNYEEEFCAAKDMEPFHRAFFAIGNSNPSVQFMKFISLVQWLAQSCNVDFSVDQYDDAGSSINQVMLVLRNMGFSLDFPASKLRQGYGDAACIVLDFLADRALATRGFNFSKPRILPEPMAEEAEADDGADVDAEEDIPDEVESEDEEEVLYSEVVRAERKEELDESVCGKLDSDIDPVEWKTELERVGPRLKVRLGHGGKEWRTHIEHTKKHEQVIKDNLPEAQKQLARIADNVRSSLDRVSAKERYMNNQFDGIVQDYKKIQAQLTEVQSRHSDAGGAVGELQNELQSISERLDEVKSSMEERNSSVTDTSPLVRIKKALQKLKQEIKQMELRVGVLCHTLMQAKLRSRSSRDAKIHAKVSREGGRSKYYEA